MNNLILLLFFSCCHKLAFCFVPMPFFSTPRLSQIFSDSEVNESDDDATVVSLQFAYSKITLVGTAHLSKKSNQQVERIIASQKPDVVMVELDKSRIERIGFNSMEEIGLPVVTADDIVVPNNENKENGKQKTWWKPAQDIATNLFLDVFTPLARKLLTGMYDDMSSTIENDDGPGGEFLVAIKAARKYGAFRIVLGDRESTQTIRRAAELTIQSGNPFDVLDRLNRANGEEMSKLEERVKLQLVESGKDIEDEATVTVAMMEAMKEDSRFRQRLFDKLEREVPEFTQVFLKERDYIMAEAIRRETDKGSRNIVGVVGLAHVNGILENLKEWSSSETQVTGAMESSDR